MCYIYAYNAYVTHLLLIRLCDIYALTELVTLLSFGLYHHNLITLPAGIIGRLGFVLVEVISFCKSCLTLQIDGTIFHGHLLI